MKYNDDQKLDFIQYLGRHYGWQYQCPEDYLHKDDLMISIKQWMVKGPNDRGATLSLLILCCPGEDPNKVFKRIKENMQTQQAWRNAQRRMEMERQIAEDVEYNVQQIRGRYGIQVKPYRHGKNRKVVIDLADLYHLVGGW